MKYATALIAAAVGAQALHKNGTIITTEVVDSYVTYCPGPMAITHGDKVYTVTKAQTLTITDCPCTITRPVLTTSQVICNTCTGAASVPTAPASDSPVTPGVPSIAPTGGIITPTKGAPSSTPTAGAGKVAALSGAGLAGIVGLAAFVL